MQRALWPLLIGISAATATAAQAGPKPLTQTRDDQSTLAITLNAEGGAEGRVLKFDWPMLNIGTGEYDAGPTGVTVVRFGKKVHGAVDVKGGAPGTVNTDYLRLGYDTPDLDAVVLSGGSWYGLETVTAVDTALKDDHQRSGYWDDVGLAVGAIIYDYGERRLNEIYPDKRLAQAAVRAAKPGIFPMGARGAGRSARTGGLFGCNAFSGQGGAFRQVGEVKVAAFTVVNALGVVTTRDGKVAACYPDKGWPADLRTTDLLNGLPGSRMPGWKGNDPDNRKNTTISLIVVNQKMSPAELQRLAVQVHTSMARAIQPFATQFDGDVLYAVSTDEVDPGAPGFHSVDVATLAGETMWDAVLNSVPPQPAVASPPSDVQPPSAAALKKMEGDYVFSPFVTLRVSSRDGKLFGQAIGKYPVFLVGKDSPTELLRAAKDLFMVPGRYPMSLRFDTAGIVINPGPWQQSAARSPIGG
jgi:L-aminopeptidase/D-esterase-like protein